jgi:hypothetical protein
MTPKIRGSGRATAFRQAVAPRQFSLVAESGQRTVRESDALAERGVGGVVQVVVRWSTTCTVRMKLPQLRGVPAMSPFPSRWSPGGRGSDVVASDHR